MLKKKPSFDFLLKSGFIFILIVLGLIGIIFGSIRISNKQSQGTVYDGGVSTTIFFSPYKEKRENHSTPIYDAFANDRDPNTTELLTDQEIAKMLSDASNVYANRLYLQGYNQVTITQNLADRTAVDLTSNSSDNPSFVNPSWLLNRTSLPSLTIAVNKNLVKEENETDENFDQQNLRSVLFNVSRSFDLSLETTDGYKIFDSNSPEFIKNSIDTIRPVSGSTTSALTFELNIPSSTINTDANGITNYINQKLTGITNSDYNTGNGETSVVRKGLFSSNDTTNTNGNRNIVLWNNKPAALQFVKNIFVVEENSPAWISFSSQEKALWNFLHKRAPYDANNDTNLVQPYRSASEININDLYYLYAKPKAYTQAPASNNGANSTTPPADVSTSGDTRTTRGGTTDYASLFSPYILYEGRVQTNSQTPTIHATVQNIFPTNQQFRFNGNTKFVLSQILQANGTYGTVNFGQATRLQSLLVNGALAKNSVIVGATTKLLKPEINNTFDVVSGLQDINAFKTSLIAFGVVLLVIGIIVSILYKVPGLFNLLGIILASVINILLYDQFGGTIDLFTFFGLFISAAIGVSSTIYINEVFRRLVRNSTSLSEAARLTYKSSFMKIVDVHLVVLVLGLLLMYVGKFQEQSIGVIFVVGSFTSFFITYGLSTLLNKVFFAIQNWVNYKLFVYKRDAKWLNEITWQIETSHHELNSSLNDTDHDLINLFKQKTKVNFLSKTSLALLLFWLLALIAGIIALVLFSQGRIFALSAITRSSTISIVIATMGSFAIGLVYFMLRYRWHISVPYLTVGLINFFAILIAPLIFGRLLNIRFQFEAILMLLGAWTISHLMIVYSIGWNYQYWFSYIIYKKQTIAQLISNNVMTMTRLSIINYFVLPFMVLVFTAFNFGGVISTNLNLYLFHLLGFISVANLVGNLTSWLLLPQLLGLMMLVRQKTMTIHENHAHGKHKKTVHSYDKIDEQLIAGINQRVIERHY
ncbi:MPN396 family protein [Mycoplasma amphoriforme]|uniref:Protein-export membrane protein SecD n=1 Tax=Mycoplasma amphoriforme A39 TaxID=572419 RepID=A0A292IHV0_9MOLU|nr:unnamed protein product [Mycoplasma amphoriforme A39]